VLVCSSTSLDLPNFESRIVSSRLVGSKSSLSRRIASPIRNPVQASSPISVPNVAARSGGRSMPAAVITATISSSR